MSANRVNGSSLSGSKPKRIWQRHRRIVFGILVVGLMLLIAVVSIPFVPSPGITLSQAREGFVPKGTVTRPGYTSLNIPNISPNQKFSVNIQSNSTGSFCALSDSPYQSWSAAYSTSPNPGNSFPWDQCLSKSRDVTSTILVFTPTTSDSWDIVTLNPNPVIMHVNYLPAA